MPTITTATANFDKTVTALVRKQILAELRSKTIWLQEAQAVDGEFVPGTNTMRFIAYRDMSVTTNSNTVTPGTPPWLTEGTAPSEEALTINYEEFTCGQAGRLLGITDVALKINPHRLVEVGSERISRNAAATVDLYIGTLINAGTDRVFYPGTDVARNTLAATDIITANLVRKVVANLKDANVEPFADGFYRAVISPMIAYDLMAETNTGGWLDVVKYAEPGAALRGEIGRFAGVRFMEHNVANLFANASNGAGAGGNIDVYSTVIFGPNFLAFGDIQTIETYFVRPGGDHTDPLAQKALVGWKGMWGARLLNAVGARYARIEAASSIGANT